MSSHIFIGILQKGDGGWLDFRTLPMVATRAKLDEQEAEAERSPVVSMAAAPDGSLYVGQGRLVRRLKADGSVKIVADFG